MSDLSEDEREWLSRQLSNSGSESASEDEGPTPSPAPPGLNRPPPGLATQPSIAQSTDSTADPTAEGTGKKKKKRNRRGKKKRGKKTDDSSGDEEERDGEDKSTGNLTRSSSTAAASRPAVVTVVRPVQQQQPALPPGISTPPPGISQAGPKKAETTQSRAVVAVVRPAKSKSETQQLPPAPKPTEKPSAEAISKQKEKATAVMAAMKKALATPEPASPAPAASKGLSANAPAFQPPSTPPPAAPAAVTAAPTPVAAVTAVASSSWADDVEAELQEEEERERQFQQEQERLEKSKKAPARPPGLREEAPAPSAARPPGLSAGPPAARSVAPPPQAIKQRREPDFVERTDEEALIAAQEARGRRLAPLPGDREDSEGAVLAGESLDSCRHVLEIYGFGSDTSHLDMDLLLNALHNHLKRLEGEEAGARDSVVVAPYLKWVDDAHCLCIFATVQNALDVLEFYLTTPLRDAPFNNNYKLRPMPAACPESLAVPLTKMQAPMPRPKTTTAVARQMIGSVLGIRQLCGGQELRDLRDQRKQRQEERRQREKDLDSAWNM